MAGFNPLSIIDPQAIADQNAIELQRQRAQALFAQGMQPAQGQMAGQVYVGPSWTQGLARMLNAYVGGKMMDDANQKSVSLAQRQGQMLRNLVNPQQVQEQPDLAPQALEQGATIGSVGPTNSNAQLLQAMKAAQAKKAPQAGGMVIPGMDPNMAAVAMSMNPEKYMEAFLDSKKLTDLQKNANAAGLGPDAVGNVVRKEGYIPPNKVGQGEVIADPITGKPLLFNPKTTDGIGVDFADPLHPTSSTLKGYPDASYAVEASKEKAKSDNQIFTNVPGPGGQPMSGRGKVLFDDGSDPKFNVSGDPSRFRQMLVNGGASPEVIAAYDKQFGGKRGVIAGPSATDAGLQKSGAEVIGAAPQQVASSRAAIRGLENALGIVEGGGKTGPGAKGALSIPALLNTLGVPLMEGDVQGYQTLQKYLQNSVMQAAQGTGAIGSDERLKSFMGGQPNAESMNAGALKSAIRYVLSQHDAAAVRGSYLQQEYQRLNAAGDPNAAQTAQASWSKLYDPRYFEIQRMPKAEQAAAVQNMSPVQAQQFMQLRKTLKAYQ